jgi:hypothetical protein
MRPCSHRLTTAATCCNAGTIYLVQGYGTRAVGHSLTPADQVGGLGPGGGDGVYCLLFLLTLVLESGFLTSLVGNTAGLLFLLLLPMFYSVAILRNRLYYIDVVINRTLVYGSLTLMLALVNFGGVTGTQAVFQILPGQQKFPQLGVVVSTLVIAALFTPLSGRIQSFIDRRFYRSKYDARKIL